VADALDVARAFFVAVNAGDPDAVAEFYHPRCHVEHTFPGHDVIEGRDQARAAWHVEFTTTTGALPDGQRYHVTRVAGLETGWGWARVSWTRRTRAGAADGHDDPATGYSDFWIEDGLILRHRTVVRREATRSPASRAASGDALRVERPRVGVGAVVVSEAGQVLLVKRQNEPLAGQWSLPGGMLELGETLEAGVAREILEETGLHVEVGPLVEVFDRILLDDQGGVRHHLVLVDYVCRVRGGVLLAATDVDAAIWADPAALAPYRLTEKAQAVIRNALRLLQ
jgi:8-oxo-dGTP diphosphatase